MDINCPSRGHRKRLGGSCADASGAWFGLHSARLILPVNHLTSARAARSAAPAATASDAFS
jgi:hypothetical protein